jgi:hypothetical protein
VLGATIAAAGEGAVGAGLDLGVHNGPLSSGRHGTAFVSVTTTEGALSFQVRPGSVAVAAPAGEGVARAVYRVTVTLAHASPEA